MGVVKDRASASSCFSPYDQSSASKVASSPSFPRIDSHRPTFFIAMTIRSSDRVPLGPKLSRSVSGRRKGPYGMTVICARIAAGWMVEILQRTAMIEKPSSMVVDAVVGNLISGYATLQILESHFGQLDLCEAHVKTAVESGSYSMLTFVLDRCSITEATPPVLLAAAAKGSLEMMKHLLKLDNAVVTEDILIAASGNYDCNVDMLKVLWNFAPHIKVPPRMFLNVEDSFFLFECHGCWISFFPS
ncbi:Galactose oxidase/kelch beta-propeller [Penicillium robsamsonii]|uniref:Galactose oxidase/kelch beta-propeller n=1 Tax=Penicillium robsamsonii TaxID=1792511 RepID=UPI0025498086|nr:Galactose oxidase/kelch beta-propeller [Penicillium robsamsonii]KAJ5826649.1 Galactose oxidase/kelch beta-propeller [Penicillium robsamsonii]